MWVSGSFGGCVGGMACRWMGRWVRGCVGRCSRGWHDGSVGGWVDGFVEMGVETDCGWVGWLIGGATGE